MKFTENLNEICFIMDKSSWSTAYFDGIQAEMTMTVETAPVVDFILSIISPDKLTMPEMIMPETFRLIDTCCGTGNVTAAIAEKGIQVVGVDASAYCIDKAQKIYERPGCEFVCDDIRSFFPVQPFDFLINWHSSFAYSPSDEENLKMVEAFSRMLKPGGKWVLSTYNPQDLRSHFQRYIVKHLQLPEGEMISIRESFLDGNVLSSNWEFLLPDGQRIYRSGLTKLYELSELISLFGQHDIVIEQAYGSLNKEPYQFHSPALILVGRKCDER
jgi:SAM-dependent methyltransferase